MEPASDGTVIVGLLADPGQPTRVAGRLASDLPEALAERVSDDVTWDVRVVGGLIPLGVSDYTALAWLSSSMGTVAGALGASLESKQTAREATFSRREQERRARREREHEAAERTEAA